MRNTGAPLKLWIFVVILAALGISADQLFYDDVTAWMATQNEEFVTEEVTSEIATSKKKFQNESGNKTIAPVKILALGTSRLGSGIGFTSYIDENLSECLGGAKVSFALAWTANAELETFFDDPKVQGLIKIYNPTHLLIEKNLLITQRKSTRRKQRRKDDVERDIERLIKRGPKNRNYRTLKPEDNRWNPKHDSTNLRYLAGYYKRKEMRDFPWQTSMDSIVQDLANHTQLIGIGMPWPMAVDSIKQHYFGEQERQTLEQIGARFNMDFILSDHKFPFRLYRDKNHLNHYGQDIYTDWMIQELCNYISKKQ